MLATLPFSLNFAHPLAEWGLLAVGGWALYLGIKAKKTLSLIHISEPTRPC